MCALVNAIKYVFRSMYLINDLIIAKNLHTAFVSWELIRPNSDPPGTMSAPFRMAATGMVLYDFVCASEANLNEGTFEILSNTLFSWCLLNHWMTTNCLPSESCKNSMHFPKYNLLIVAPSLFSSSRNTLIQSCATIPWYRGIARKITVCSSWYLNYWFDFYLI